jgi:acetylornithine deacetylase/succinyl-diaminopimelate desuccinylase-like protein
VSDVNMSNGGEVVDLLQHLIRNACVNEDRVDSGHEIRNADLLTTYLEGTGLEIETYDSAPGRRSVVARMEGSDPQAPSLMLMGHTDVVPVNPERWSHDPFGGEIIDGEVWGRGAVDMLNLTSSMAVAFRNLARSGWKPRGTLIYLGVADEEALGSYGAGYLTEHHLDAVTADYVLTESGGIPIPSPSGIKLPVIVGEKGSYWCRLRVRGTAGHGSQPYRTENALVRAAEVVRRLDAYRPEAQFHAVWEQFIRSMGYPDEITTPLLTAGSIDEMLETLPLGMARQFHACTHATFTPTMVEGGTKINVIPDTVELKVDVRLLPGQTEEDASVMFEEALAEMAEQVEIEVVQYDPSSASEIRTPLWDTLGRVTQEWYGGSETVPYLTVGATDARFFRRTGSVAYGFGLFSSKMSFEDYGTMFHGDDERIDIESLVLSTQLWEATARDLLS